MRQPLRGAHADLPHLVRSGAADESHRPVLAAAFRDMARRKAFADSSGRSQTIFSPGCVILRIGS